MHLNYPLRTSWNHLKSCDDQHFDLPWSRRANKRAGKELISWETQWEQSRANGTQEDENRARHHKNPEHTQIDN